jgi:hypothetical protein
MFIENFGAPVFDNCLRVLTTTLSPLGCFGVVIFCNRSSHGRQLAMASVVKQTKTTITRGEARSAGRTRYFTGKPCPHGHLSERLTVNGTCVTCTSLKTASRRERADSGLTEKFSARDWPKGISNRNRWDSFAEQVLQQLYTELRNSFEVVHNDRKVDENYPLNIAAEGLRCWTAIVEMIKQANNVNRTQFNSDTDRLQRPANVHSGGAFDPQPTEHEWQLIRMAEEHGAPLGESLRTLRERMDIMASAYEQHVAKLLARTIVSVSATRQKSEPQNA